MRPSWENITEIVYNIDKQTLVIQRLMLECDWGEALPEYKTRPKRPVTPSQSSRSGRKESTTSNSSLTNLPSNLVQMVAKIIPGVKPRVRDNQYNKIDIDNQEWLVPVD